MGLVVNGAIHHTDRVGCLVMCALGHVRLHYTGGFLFDCYSTRVTTSAKCCIDSSAGIPYHLYVLVLLKKCM